LPGQSQLYTLFSSAEPPGSKRGRGLGGPETVEADLARYPSAAEMRRLLQGAGFRHVVEKGVQFPYQLTDIKWNKT
jgi:hypothetical protein